ncbi:MAG: protein kinase [Cystobacterineae bacterium]|nr:protein kinase [Cystobacterineae bacterium]
MKTTQALGPFHIGERLYRGGCWEDCLATRMNMHGYWRLRRLLPLFNPSELGPVVFANSARLASSLKIASVLQLQETGLIENTHYCVLEYPLGDSLAGLWLLCQRKNQKLSPAMCCRIMSEVCEAIAQLYSMRDSGKLPTKILFQELSPRDIWVCSDGQSKLDIMNTTQTHEKMALLSHNATSKQNFYALSPERLLAKPIDERSDVFCLGALLYKMLTGSYPFLRADENATLQALCEAKAPSPSSVNPNIPYAIDSLLLHALKANPAERFASVAKMHEALVLLMAECHWTETQMELASFMSELMPPPPSGAQ